MLPTLIWNKNYGRMKWWIMREDVRCKTYSEGVPWPFRHPFISSLVSLER